MSARASGRWRVGLLAVVCVATFVGAKAAVTLGYPTSEVRTSVIPSPVKFEKGPGADKDRHFKDFTLSANATSFTGTLKPKPGAESKIKDVVRVHNIAPATKTVTLRAETVTNDRVESMTWIVRNGGTMVALFNYKAAAPTATFPLPPGAKYTMELRVDLADGAGKHDADFPFGLRLEIS